MARKSQVLCDQEARALGHTASHESSVPLCRAWGLAEAGLCNGLVSE